MEKATGENGKVEPIAHMELIHAGLAGFAKSYFHNPMGLLLENNKTIWWKNGVMQMQIRLIQFGEERITVLESVVAKKKLQVTKDAAFMLVQQNLINIRD